MPYGYVRTLTWRRYDTLMWFWIFKILQNFQNILWKLIFGFLTATTQGTHGHLISSRSTAQTEFNTIWI